MEELRKAKAQCLDDLKTHLPDYVAQLNAIDERLVPYIEDAISNDGSHANLYELLGIRKVLRLMDSYDLDTERVQRTLRAIEGVWQKDKHVKGGLAFDTPRGNRHVRLMPYQSWCVFGIYGFKHDVCMERTADGGELLPTEWVGEDGMVWDTRRLTEECHLFQTRKSGKTEFGAALDFTEACFLGPANAQVFICSPSAKISKTAYKAVKEFATQVDPTCLNRLGGKYFRLTADSMNWQPGHRMKGEITCMAAGKTPKDSFYAYIVHADEHGQPGYINGKCDMQSAVETLWGSTGPRRERLLMHTTTAGLNMEGPYRNQLRTVEQSLLNELNFPLGESHRTPEDKWFAFLLQLDPWEQGYDLDQLDNPELFKKVNRSIGITVQPTYYSGRIYDARKSDDTRKEVLTKDFNIWQTGRVTEWLKPEEIRAIQVPMRIDDCTADQGWEVMVGSDFSKGDDLNGNAYLAKRWREDLGEMEYFADIDAYMSEDAVNDNPIRELLLKWAADGWLHIVPGKTFDPAVAVNRIIELDAKNVNFFGFGYDPYNAKTVINALTQWLCDVGLDPKTLIKPVRQNFATYSPAVKEFDYMVKRGIQQPDGKVTPNPMIHLSPSPLWPWEFGNCQLAESTDGMGNLKPIKATSASSCKVDHVQMILSALILHDAADSAITPT